jgi:hypothetical protein
MRPAEILLAYDDNDVKPGWVALIVVIVLGIATFLLWRSMNTQLRKIRAPHQADLDESGTPRVDPDRDVPVDPDTPRVDPERDGPVDPDTPDTPDTPSPEDPPAHR